MGHPSKTVMVCPGRTLRPLTYTRHGQAELVRGTRSTDKYGHRGWYKQALENPSVQVTVDGVKGAYIAVPVTSEEHDRVDRENSLGMVIRVLTGFPPRYFVRLDPG